MGTPVADGHFNVNAGALRNAEAAVNGMALSSTTTGKTAGEATNAAASAHRSWETAPALRGALAEWHHQMDQLIYRPHVIGAPLTPGFKIGEERMFGDVAQRIVGTWAWAQGIDPQASDIASLKRLCMTTESSYSKDAGHILDRGNV
ncbi:hypothetical protein ACFRAR_33860 [Kitasatospora sp. NPDC056651]|uniref:hypothetical protein n=1 Tax=Kitasatospora sp. NPDC056651 TaxID=3345892 RepID=UPI00368F077B